MSLGETMMNWLRRVEPDQNLQGIGNLGNTRQDGVTRRWFKRQDLTPTLATGHYDPRTETFCMDTEQIHEVVCNVDATSAAATTWTVTAGQTWRIKQMALLNGTRAFRPDIVITPVGSGALHLINLVTLAAGTRVSCIGGGDGAANQSNTGWDLKDLTLEAGSTIVLTDTQFVAADTMSHELMYEVIR